MSVRVPICECNDIPGVHLCMCACMHACILTCMHVSMQSYFFRTQDAQ